MRSRTRRTPLVLPIALGAGLAAACGGGGGGGGGGQPSILAESEPNDTTATADMLVLGRPAAGTLAAAGDVDCFSVDLIAGRYVRVELFATRLDQEGWDAAANVPQLTLLAPDGVTSLLAHDPDDAFSDGWGWGRHDLDFPLYRVPANGTYFLRLAQADPLLPGARYAVRAVYETHPAAVAEFEPVGTSGANDTPNTAQDIQPGVVHGFHVEGDLDYYAVTVAAPTIVRFEVQSYREGVHDGDDGYFDPALQLFDANGSSVLAFDDDSFFFDPAIHFALVDPGTYFLEVGECCGVGDGDYLLLYASAPAGGATETEPNDLTAQADPIAYGGAVSGSIDAGETDLFTFAGTAGDMVRIQVFDGFNTQDEADFVTVEVLAPDGTTLVPTGGFFELQTVTTILQEDGMHFLRVVPGGALTDYRLELSRFQSATRESEPNDTIATADALVTRAAGVVDAPGDVDVFRFDAPQDRLAVVAIYAGPSATGSDGFFEYSGHGSDLQPELTVTDGQGAVLATCTSNPASVFTESVTDGLPTAAVAFVPSSPGPFYVHVESAFGTGTATHTYVVERR
jgi:hypothetical protein